VRKPGASDLQDWGYPVAPLIFLILSLLLIDRSCFLAPATAGVGYLIGLTGIPVYLIWRNSYRTESVMD
jgi:APA family basic amino acid/polyamine antiporter